VEQVQEVMQGKKSLKEATGAIGNKTESVFLKQKFGKVVEGVWNATSAPMALRQIKLAEGLIKGKSLKEAAAESQQVEKDAPINKASDWLGSQTKQFIKQDLPEAASFAKKDVQEKFDQVKSMFQEKGKELFGKRWPFE
jgi:hypothetical protein